MWSAPHWLSWPNNLHSSSRRLHEAHCRACRRNLGSAFRTHILNAKDSEGSASATPVRVLGSCSFLYMRSSDVYILAVTRNNANAMLTFQFMSNVCAAADRTTLPTAGG